MVWHVDFGNAKSRHESTHRKKHQRHQRYTGNGENWAVVLFQKRFTGTLTQSALQQQRQRVRYTSSTSGVTIVRWRFSVIGFMAGTLICTQTLLHHGMFSLSM
ncbi:MAG TPA: hypothetical protein V6C85_10045 [Allocoleopsis sp.]